MDKFTKVTGPACPINHPNLNTDQILPARYLKWTRAMGIGKVLFYDLRFDAEGNFDPATDLIALDAEREGAFMGQTAPVQDAEAPPASRRW